MSLNREARMLQDFPAYFDWLSGDGRRTANAKMDEAMIELNRLQAARWEREAKGETK